MELYYILLLYFIDQYHLPSKQLLTRLSPLREKYAILGIPAQHKNLYRSIYRLEATGYIHSGDGNSSDRRYTTTPRGKAVLAEYFTIHDSLFLFPKVDPSFSSSSLPIPGSKPDPIHPQPLSLSSATVEEENDSFDPVHEILVDYIPIKTHAKISSFSTWCQKTPKLTPDTLQTKLITMFWGDDHLVPKSMAAKFPELIDRLLAVI